MAACFRYPQDVETRADSYCGEWAITVKAANEEQQRRIEMNNQLFRKPNGRLL